MSKIDPKTRTDGEMLVKEYLKTKSPVLKEKIVAAFSPLVKYIVGRINISQSGILGTNDLYQCGMIGLLDALERFRLDTGVPFKNFAYKRIHGEVVDALRREGLVGRNKFEQIKSLENTISSLTSRLCREPLPSEVCEVLNITEEQYYSILNTSQLNYTISLNGKVSDEDGEVIYLLDTIEDEAGLSPEEVSLRNNLKEKLKSIIPRLPERERLIMALYFYEELTLADIGQVLRLSESMISQILNKMLLKIRAELLR